MNKPRNRNAKRVVLNCKIDPATDAAIRRLSDALGISQSEVVDKAMEALAFMLETGKFTNEQEQPQ